MIPNRLKSRYATLGTILVVLVGCLWFEVNELLPILDKAPLQILILILFVIFFQIFIVIGGVYIIHSLTDNPNRSIQKS